jgi:hypothetical protein
MNAAAEIKQRAPYRGKKWWISFDSEMSEKFPIGVLAKCRRGPGGLVSVKVLSRCTRGKIEVLNMITGKQYRCNVESMVPPSTMTVLQMAEAVQSERVRRAEEQRQERSRPSIVRKYLEPITTADRRNPEYVDRARILPLSNDELTAYTAISAICKTLNNLHLNRDSFRNQKLFDLLRASHACLETCIREMETYDELPTDA